jgi:periplasmic divalent cation tolerance protein
MALPSFRARRGCKLLSEVPCNIRPLSPVSSIIEGTMSAGQNQILVVFCTCPADGTAEKLAKELVNRRLAACVNILPTARSIYQWQGKVEQQDESVLMIKTTREGYSSLEKTIVKNHPYQVPEILAVPIVEGFDEYLKWVEEVSCTKS